MTFTSNLKLPEQSEAEARAAWAAYHEFQAYMQDMMANNMELGDPSIPHCRAEAKKERAIARRYRGER